MRLLIWHWGRNGAGPRYAAALARHLRDAEIDTLLSLPDGAEILRQTDAPAVDLPVRTYSNMRGFLRRAAMAPLRIRGLARRIRALHPDMALCAMPAMLDLWMVAALRRLRVPIAVVIHDAAPHPGERVPLQHRLQRMLLRRADIVITLSTHVADQLRRDGLAKPARMIASTLPPLDYGAVPPPYAHGGKPRLLSFGRLLPYKGMDLLRDALRLLGPDLPFELRVVGQGPESPVLDDLRAIPGVAVENRWVPEDEVGALLGWADAIVLSHREASQSGVAAAALVTGRWIVATRVGGLMEQLQVHPLALLCDPDPENMAATLTRLQSSPPSFEQDPAASWPPVARGLAAALHQEHWRHE